jgi:hypothetical protein
MNPIVQAFRNAASLPVYFIAAVILVISIGIRHVGAGLCWVSWKIEAAADRVGRTADRISFFRYNPPAER